MSLETRQKERRDRRVERTRWADDVPPPRGSWWRLLMEALGEQGLLACAWGHEMHAVDRGLRFIDRATRAIAHAIDALCGIGPALVLGTFIVLGTYPPGCLSCWAWAPSCCPRPASSIEPTAIVATAARERRTGRWSWM